MQQTNFFVVIIIVNAYTFYAVAEFYLLQIKVQKCLGNGCIFEVAIHNFLQVIVVDSCRIVTLECEEKNDIQTGYF